MLRVKLVSQPQKGISNKNLYLLLFCLYYIFLFVLYILFILCIYLFYLCIYSSWVNLLKGVSPVRTKVLSSYDVQITPSKFSTICGITFLILFSVCGIIFLLSFFSVCRIIFCNILSCTQYNINLNSLHSCGPNIIQCK